MSEEWVLDCDVCGNEWLAPVVKGEHRESCPKCGATLVMDGDSIEYVETNS